ncbi:MAG: HD-GYP domain-containing protein [Clostridiales bacterium]|nr:HD-GYP domain-containing protein [Clostridiales bacterium]
MFKGLNFKTKAYLIFIYLLALLLIIFCFKKYGFNINASLSEVVLFCFLKVVSESLQVYFNNMTISTGFTITLASMVIFNPVFVIIVITIGMLFRVVKNNNKYYHIFNTPAYKTLFNISLINICFIVSSQIYEACGGRYGNPEMKDVIFPIFLFGIVFWILNWALLCLLMHYWRDMRFSSVIFQNSKVVFLGIICMIPLGIIILEAYKAYGYIGVLVIFGPIMLARYSFVMYSNMKKAYVDTVKALSLAIEAKDKYTEGHSMRVFEYAEKIARNMKYSEEHIENLRIASLLHDIGKIGIPEAILNKPGRLSEDEYAVIKQHPVIGANIIKDVDALKKSPKIVRWHHERYDGKGYPDGIGGDDIPLDAYIISIADAFDAMRSDRPYRRAMTKSQAVNIIKDERGKQFHPKVADVFLDILKSEGDK